MMPAAGDDFSARLAAAQHLDWIQPGNPTYAATVPRIIAWFQQHLPPQVTTIGATGAREVATASQA